MKNLFEATNRTAIESRLAGLDAQNVRKWGKMNASQAVAHCSLGVEMALGELRPPRMLIGRLLGPFIKNMALRDDAPMRKNSPTVPGMVVGDDRNLAAEKEKLRALIDRFAVEGPASNNTHPHAFFGRLTPAEWSVLMYKHIDHHLRQFGA